MGPNESRNLSAISKIRMNKNYFEFRYIIGKGGFGKVWKVAFKKNNKLYALKEMSKVKIIDRKSEKSIKNERDFLSKMHHPFIVNMMFSFQDYENLYLVMDLLTGGDLRYHICRYGTFSEEQTKFFIGCVLLGLEYIHSNNIIHRDIKPENLVCDENGYIRITDFGVAKTMQSNNGNETSGTPGYMAPEVLCGQNHNFLVDFFAIGVMGYEFMFGERPYLGGSRKEIKQAVLRKQVIILPEDIPLGWSFESADFINKMIKRKSYNRLGCDGGIQEIKNHPWFDNFNWTELMNKEMISPFLPKSSGNYDKKYCEALEHLNQETIERYQNYLQNDNYGSVFNGYTYLDEQEVNSYFLKSQRGQFQQSTVSTLDNRPTNTTLSNRETQAFKFKMSYMRNKPGLSINLNAFGAKTPYKCQESANNLLSQKNKAEITRFNKNLNLISRNRNRSIHHNYYRRNSSAGVENPMNYKSGDELIKSLKPKSLSINVSNRLNMIKKNGGSQSCKSIKHQLPVLGGHLKQNSSSILVFKDANNKPSTSNRKMVLPLSLSNGNFSKAQWRKDIQRSKTFFINL